MKIFYILSERERLEVFGFRLRGLTFEFEIYRGLFLYEYTKNIDLKLSYKKLLWVNRRLDRK